MTSRSELGARRGVLGIFRAVTELALLVAALVWFGWRASGFLAILIFWFYVATAWSYCDNRIESRDYEGE